MNTILVQKLRRALLRWFAHHRRDLPWRKDRGPYRVWVSEIMLQQTRVAAVLDHYGRFLKRFPDVRTLAQAQAATVLAAWSGLGYYRRARLMHAAARQIVRERQGRFPRTSAEWLGLPGIGRYTAAAIASICYDEPCAVVDGNVERVLQRLRGCTAAQTWGMADRLLSRRRPGDFNQALMELGALVCTPRSPNCGECPLCKHCATAKGTLLRLPLSRQTRLRVEVMCALCTEKNRVLLTQRGKGETVMPGMWELPVIDGATSFAKRGLESCMTLNHAVMNTNYTVRVMRPGTRNSSCVVRSGKWFHARQAARLPLTGLARKILKRAQII